MSVASVKQVSAAESWPMLAENDAVLVDCRSIAEWAFVGIPDLSGYGKEVVTIEWTRMNGLPVRGKVKCCCRCCC